MEQQLVERARRIAADALSDLAGRIEAGRVEALARHLAAMARFPRHSWTNVLLIAAQRPEATQVASLHAWRAVGRSVTPGEKGIIVLDFEPGVPKASGGALVPKEDVRPSVRASYVYVVSQTEGKPIPERPPGEAKREHGEARALTAALPDRSDRVIFRHKLFDIDRAQEKLLPIDGFDLGAMRRK